MAGILLSKQSNGDFCFRAICNKSGQVIQEAECRVPQTREEKDIVKFRIYKGERRRFSKKPLSIFELTEFESF